MTAIDYFFTAVSPFTYLGHRAFLVMVARHGAAVRYKPVMLGGVWEHSGGVPLNQRPQSRQDYRLIELQRWRDKRGVTLNLRPKHFPTSPVLADRSIVALVERGEDPGAYMESVCRAVWAEDEDIADRNVLAQRLTRHGHDADAVLAFAESEAAAAIQKRNTDEAVAFGVLGAPGYVLNGEPFWGQDRIELLEDALVSHRAPYSSAAGATQAS